MYSCGLDSAKNFSQYGHNKVYLLLSTFDSILHPDTKGKSNLVENILPESLETKHHVCKLCMRTFSEDEFEAADNELLVYQNCSQIESAPKILASRIEENWRGLVTKASTIKQKIG